MLDPMNRFPPHLGCGHFSSCSTATRYPKCWNAKKKKVFCDVIASVLCTCLQWARSISAMYSEGAVSIWSGLVQQFTLHCRWQPKGKNLQQFIHVVGLNIQSIQSHALLHTATHCIPACSNSMQPRGGINQHTTWYACSSQETSKKGRILALWRRRCFQKKGIFFTSIFDV